MNTVVDASVALRWYLDEPGADAADRILREGIEGERRLFAPDLILAEFANALWKRVRLGGCGPDEAAEILAMFLGDAPHLLDIAPLTERALELAIQLGESVYDCLYLAAAIESGASLVTADQRFARRARTVLAEVELIG